MGAAHSRARPGAGPGPKFVTQREETAALAKAATAANNVLPGSKKASVGFGYFILCIKSGDRVKVVNAANSVLRQIGDVIKRHFVVTKSGWDRHLGYSFKLQVSDGERRISLID